MNYVSWLKEKFGALQVESERWAVMPMVPVLFYWMAGCMVVGLPLSQSFTSVLVCVPLLLVGVFVWRIPNKRRISLFVCGGVVTGVVWWCGMFSTRFPEGKYVEIEADVSDLISVSRDFCYNDHVGLEAVVKRFRLPGRGWLRCDERVMVRLSKGRSYTYGERVWAGGYFFRPSESAYAGGFDYRSFLRMKGISWTFSSRWSTGRVGVGWRGWFSWLVECREFVLGRLAYAIESPPLTGQSRGLVDGSDKVRVVLAMAMGLKGNLTKVEKRAFVKGGMFHLFAVSGLHVGIVAMIMLFVLRLVPYRLRYFLLPFVLFVYIMMVGGPPSAVRAWLMISIWAFGRAFYLPTNHYNTIASAAFILLVLNPFLLFQAGFQFSFLVVLFLIASFSWHQRLMDTLSERSLWMPVHCAKGRVVKRCLFGVLSSFILGLTVTLAVSGLQAFYYGLFIPSSVLFASLTGVLALIILSLAMLKVAVAGVGYWLVGPLNGVLGFMLGMISQLAHWLGGGGLYSSFAKPGFLSVVGYYLAAWFLVVSSRIWLRVACLVVVVGLIFSWHLSPGQGYNILCLRKKRAGVPAVIIPSRLRDEVILLNPGEGRQGYLLDYYFRDHGIETVAMLVITEPKLGKDADLAVGNRLVRRLVLPMGWEALPDLVALKNRLVATGTRVSVFARGEGGMSTVCGALSVCIQNKAGESVVSITHSGLLFPQLVRLSVERSGVGRVDYHWQDNGVVGQRFDHEMMSFRKF